jgi:DmsE family decaheme c-type cytochrome
MHVEKLGDKGAIRAFSAMEPKQVLDTCLGCHASDLYKDNIRRSSHTNADVVCTSCHSIHHSPTPRYLLTKVQREVCYGCHAPIRSQFSMPFKHRVNEGFMQCTDCHNPHGAVAASWRMGQRPKMVEPAPANEEPCLKCHTDKRGPFVFEHAAVRVEGCETCHNPHGSMNAKLLKRPAVFTVCLECHNGADSFGRRAVGVDTLSAAHNLANPRYRDCTVCHVRIHGSNADIFLLR